MNSASIFPAVDHAGPSGFIGGSLDPCLHRFCPFGMNGHSRLNLNEERFFSSIRNEIYFFASVSTPEIQVGSAPAIEESFDQFTEHPVFN